MLCANPMPRSNDAALEQRKRGFHGIRVHVANRVDAVLVSDDLVPREDSGLCEGLRVSWKFVGHDYVNILRDVLTDVLRQRSGLNVLSRVPQVRPSVGLTWDHFTWHALPAAIGVLRLGRDRFVASSLRMTPANLLRAEC